MFTVIIFIVVLSILVLVHELGHFFVAKFFKVKVEEFGFGFPLTPPLFSFKKGETKYSFYPALIGGFVKLYGEDEAGGGKLKISNKQQAISNKRELGRAFFAKPIYQRFLIVVAGVVMNFVLAVVITSYLFGVVGVNIPDRVVITEVIKGSPAQSAGIRENDEVVEINGQQIKTTDDLIGKTRENLGKEITLKIEDSQGNIREVKVNPRKNAPSGQGPLGIGIKQEVIAKKYPLYQAPIAGTAESVKVSWTILGSLGTTVSEIVTEREVPKGVAGPVGVAQLTGEFARLGPNALLTLVSLLSLNLAILNVLPIPALDGGRLFFLLVEATTRKKVNPRFEAYVHAIGMALVLALLALITFHDLGRIFSGTPIIPR